MKRRILIVCPCPTRGNSIGLIETFLTQFDTLDRTIYSIDLFDTNFYQDHNAENYKVDKYYKLRIRTYERVIRKIPKFRATYSQVYALRSLEHILKNNKYDFVIFYQIPPLSDKMVKACHQFGAKTVLFPWGSEVLRADEKEEKHLCVSYNETDFVVGYEDSNLINKARNVYKVPDEKIKEQKVFFKGLKCLLDADKNLNRTEMSKMVGIPPSSYNIICGYSGSRSHRHKEIIEAIAKVEDSLPSNYQLVFPMTYAGEEGYVSEVRSFCDNYGLHSVFLTNFLTDNQMAHLHLISDLYINIQPTDAGSAFMIEALFCENQIIVGKWLNYCQFEKYGTPYYIIDSIEDLPNMLKDIFIGKQERVVVPKGLIEKYKNNLKFSVGAFWQDLLTTTI